MMKNYLLILILIISCLASSCKKDKDKYGPGAQPQPQQQLPPITTSGKNTFGCLVNGQVWLPEVKPYQMFVYPLQSSYQNNIFYVKARKRINIDIYQSIDFQINNLLNEQQYFLNSVFENWGGFHDLIIDCLYITDSLQIGTVDIIKLDVPNKIIAGTFELKLWKNGCDTIHITEGRFDVKFAQ